MVQRVQRSHRHTDLIDSQNVKPEEAKKSGPTGMHIFPDTLTTSVSIPEKTPKEDPLTNAGLLDWFCNWYYGESKQKNKESTSTLPPRPELALPSALARSHMEKLIEATRDSNRVTSRIEEDTHSEARIYKKIVAVFKDLVQLNEQLLKNSAEDYKERGTILKGINASVKVLRDELNDTQNKEALAKTTAVALNILAIGILTVTIASAVYSAGLTAAAVPAVIQAMSSGTYTLTQGLATGAQATTAATRTYLEGRRNHNQSESLGIRHKQDELFFEYKSSHQEFNQFVKYITQIWSALKEIEGKRQEINRMQS